MGALWDVKRDPMRSRIIRLFEKPTGQSDSCPLSLRERAGVRVIDTASLVPCPTIERPCYVPEARCLTWPELAASRRRFRNLQHLVHFDVLQNLTAPARPENSDLVDGVPICQAELQLDAVHR